MKAIQIRDVCMTVYLTAIAGISWLVPEKLWEGFCLKTARLSSFRRRAERRRLAGILAGRVNQTEANGIVARVEANRHLSRLQLLRCYRWGSWRPRLTAAGLEHVERALREGKGAILWVAPFVFSYLVAKMTLHGQGLRLIHLSRAHHGFSQTPFGQRFLNPVCTAIEARYVGERLVMSSEQSVAALRALIERVRKNEAISITMCDEGLRKLHLPFLTGTLRVAEGAPNLSRRTGAPLLPVFSVRTGANDFVTTIEAPIAMNSPQDWQICCGRLVESYALRYPDQFNAWNFASAESDREFPSSGERAFSEITRTKAEKPESSEVTQQRERDERGKTRDSDERGSS